MSCTTGKLCGSQQKKGGHPVYQVAAFTISGGDEGARTPDPHVANVVLSQLSYIPTDWCA